MVNPSAQQIIDGAADAAVSQQYPNSLQQVVAASGNTSIHITNINEYTTIRVSSPGEPAGNTSEVQFNTNGRMNADDGLTYNPTTDSLTVLGNLTTGYLLTNNLKYANGVNWSFSSSSYSNANTGAYLPTYVGNLNPNKVTASLFEGNGANLTNIPAANLTGTITATTATTAGTVTTNAQPNITSVGTLSSVSVTGNITAGNITATHYGSGAGLTSIAGANVSGTVPNATNATTAGTANTVAGANVTGTVANATNSTNATFAGTVTSAAQSNITSVGTLNGLTATGTINLTGSSNVSLGPIGNIRITGGSNGQVLAATSTPGVVQWSTPTVGTLQDVTTNGANTSVAINITNTTVSTNYNNGALKVAGGVGVGENLHVLGHVASDSTIYSGHLSDFGSWTVPLFVGRDAGSEYVQGALVNTNANGSADWVAYNDASGDDGGSTLWSDFGFTGTTFSDTAYTITKANDGYFFVQGRNGVGGGNLVIATGDEGGTTHRDIVFATGGFLIGNEKMRLNHEDSTLYVGAHGEAGGTNVVSIDTNGNLTVAGVTSLGGVGNVKITGGTDGQVLTTDGAGNLSFTTVSGGANTGDFTFTNNVMAVPADTDMVISVVDESGDGYTLKQSVTDGTTVLAFTSLEDGQFSIYPNGGSGEEWRFDGNTLQVTNNSFIRGFDSNITIQSMSAGGTDIASLQSVSNQNDPNVFSTFDATPTGANIKVYNGGSVGGTEYTWQFDNNGNLTVPGHILPNANVSFDLGSTTNRFRDLYLSGTTIDIGGTLIQAQANGEVSIGNATFSSSGTISAADVSIGIVALNANTVATLSHVGSMLTYGNIGGGVTYEIPNNATTSFTVGSRIELLALSQANIMVMPATGSGVTLITSKDLNTNSPILSNIQSAKLTKIGTDTWYLGL